MFLKARKVLRKCNHSLVKDRCKSTSLGMKINMRHWELGEIMLLRRDVIRKQVIALSSRVLQIIFVSRMLDVVK